MGLVMLILSILFVSNAYAEKIITVTLTDEEYKAMSVLVPTPEEWANNAVKNKARKMIDELVDKNSDKKVIKMTEEEKNAVMNSIDLVEEKASRNL